MNKKNISDFYPLSPMQQGMLFHSFYAPDSGVYMEQISCELHGDLQVSAFIEAWERTVARHSILRTGFVGERLKEPIQIVHRQVDLPFRQQDWRSYASTEQELELEDLLATERQRGFDVAKPPLMRLHLIQMAEAKQQFVWTYHHILLDGWSMPILLQEVFAQYEAVQHGQALPLPKPRPFRDYISWLKKQDMAQAEAYWRHTLDGFTAPTPLVVDKAISSAEAGQSEFREEELVLSVGETAVLQTLARKNRLTLNTIVQGAWAILLGRYNDKDDVLFGATVSGRPPELPGSEQMVGLFINTLPTRIQIDNKQTILDWLINLQAQQLEMRQFEFSPLVEIQKWSQVPQGISLFDSLFVFENYPFETENQAPGSSLELLNIQSAEQTNFPINIVVGLADKLHLKILYDTNRFELAKIKRMLAHLQNILHEMGNNPTQTIPDISLLTTDEKQLLLNTWNNTQVPYPQEQLVHQLIEAQAAQQPERQALVGDGRGLTYQELNQRSNQLARYLRKQGVEPGTFVSICAPRSPELIMAALAVFKAGGAYVPLDPAHPAERLNFMLQDTNPRVVVVTDGSPAVNVGTSILVNLDQGWSQIAQEDDTNLDNSVDRNNSAYAIYTSGSTGKPKGVLIQHDGLLNLIHWHQRTFSITAADQATQLAGPGFDATVWEIWPYLARGATIHIADDVTRMNPEMLRDWLLANQITVTFLPTPLAEQVLTLNWPQESTLRIMLTGGDQLHHYPPANLPFSLVNNYGPTEDTVVSTSGMVPTDDGTSTPPTIGCPVDNAKVFVLDAQQRLVPIGVSGELCIGGISLAWGYLNRPRLTAEKFVHITVDESMPPERLYKTGDLVRYQENGEIEFLGRIDNQVSVRGFRIELGEIEAMLGQHVDVKTAVVNAIEAANEKQLVAYILPRNEHPLESNELRAFLRQKMPLYMVPSQFMILDSLPITANGKVDRRALPRPEMLDDNARYDPIPPRDSTEAKLVAIWTEILKKRTVGITDDFFALGGHSLTAVRLMARIEQEFGQAISLTEIFQDGTIANLAKLLRQQIENKQADKSNLVVLQGQGKKRPLFFIHPSGGSVHWYMDLAQHLGTERPFYGIQARGLNDNRPIHTDITEMAAFYIDTIRAQQPEGPYLIGSWSLGVIIAYEIARQLTANGQIVEKLILFDQGPELPTDEPEDNAAYLVDTFGKNIPLSLKRLRRLKPDEQILFVFTKAKQTNWLLPDVTFQQFKHYVNFLRTHTDAWRAYEPQSYSGRVTLFRADEQSSDNPDPDMGWGTLATGGVDIIQVPGDHITMLHEPNVQVLAQAIQSSLEQIPIP